MKANGLTVGRAFALYHDPMRGPVATFSRGWQGHHERARRRWEAHLGERRPWAKVSPAEVRAYAMRRLQEVGRCQLEKELKTLSAVANWLADAEGIEVANPVRRSMLRSVRQGYEPEQPRYTRDEVDRIRAAAWRVDPRVGLFVVLMDELGTRGGELLSLRRSDVGRSVWPQPNLEEAPHGWIALDSRHAKSRRSRLLILTSAAREAIDRSLRGYLRLLEARGRAKGTDYPIFPAGPLLKDGKAVVGGHAQLVHDRAEGVAIETERPLNRRRMLLLLHHAERAAWVPAVRGRAFHGFRRLATDEQLDAGVPMQQVAEWLGHASIGMLDRVYRSRGRISDVAAAARARAR